MPGPSHWASPGPKGPVDHQAVLCQTTGSLADLRQWDIHTTRTHLDLLMDNIEVPQDPVPVAGSKTELLHLEKQNNTVLLLVPASCARLRSIAGQL